jgi:hypothetical protein
VLGYVTGDQVPAAGAQPCAVPSLLRTTDFLTPQLYDYHMPVMYDYHMPVMQSAGKEQPLELHIVNFV